MTDATFCPVIVLVGDLDAGEHQIMPVCKVSLSIPIWKLCGGLKKLKLWSYRLRICKWNILLEKA